MKIVKLPGRRVCVLAVLIALAACAVVCLIVGAWAWGAGSPDREVFDRQIPASTQCAAEDRHVNIGGLRLPVKPISGEERLDQGLTDEAGESWNWRISGRVVGESGRGLAGVRVWVSLRTRSRRANGRGISLDRVTNEEGEFEVSVKSALDARLTVIAHPSDGLSGFRLTPESEVGHGIRIVDCGDILDARTSIVKFVRQYMDAKVDHRALLVSGAGPQAEVLRIPYDEDGWRATIPNGRWCVGVEGGVDAWPNLLVVEGDAASVFAFSLLDDTNSRRVPISVDGDVMGRENSSEMKKPEVVAVLRSGGRYVCGVMERPSQGNTFMVFPRLPSELDPDELVWQVAVGVKLYQMQCRFMESEGVGRWHLQRLP